MNNFKLVTIKMESQLKEEEIMNSAKMFIKELESTKLNRIEVFGKKTLREEYI